MGEELAEKVAKENGAEMWSCIFAPSGQLCVTEP